MVPSSGRLLTANYTSAGSAKIIDAVVILISKLGFRPCVTSLEVSYRRHGGLLMLTRLQTLNRMVTFELIEFVIADCRPA
jgi:hypothetical protein